MSVRLHKSESKNESYLRTALVHPACPCVQYATCYRVCNKYSARWVVLIELALARSGMLKIVVYVERAAIVNLIESFAVFH